MMQFEMARGEFARFVHQDVIFSNVSLKKYIYEKIFVSS